MTISETQRQWLMLLRDIYDVSSSCTTKTYIWGGMVQDILSGQFLRDHSDIDGFTLNLWDSREDMAARYAQKGYAVSFLEDVGFLRLERDGYHAVFNQLELNRETSLWRHAGHEGTVYFPRRWLAEKPQDFYDTTVYVSGIELEYAIKHCPYLLNPTWRTREKDIATSHWLNDMLDKQQIEREAILKQIWSYNLYWAKRGYAEYTMPAVAWPLEPHSRSE
jgi:hypothetical protein